MNDKEQIIIDVKFRKFLNAEQVKNVLEGVDFENIVLWGKTIDDETFQPMLWIIIKNPGMSLAQSTKFIITYEDLVDSGFLDKFPKF